MKYEETTLIVQRRPTLFIEVECFRVCGPTDSESITNYPRVKKRGKNYTLWKLASLSSAQPPNRMASTMARPPRYDSTWESEKAIRHVLHWQRLVKALWDRQSELKSGEMSGRLVRPARLPGRTNRGAGGPSAHAHGQDGRRAVKQAGQGDSSWRGV